ncbi:3-hydroxyacyl-CoA dehydrogenase [Paraburkholderia sp. USG1]|uniref:3-hydroxyacyl-CoA dehydrogenase n=1 Tax=Paraburkholderia sp. USG1 TaxID=2952268 RepID=UPI002864AE60|nr:3-hydroxyacyl-CoA dehydrogenase [Paraburkholderia sp. USG1]MDR8394724.1 3-hydroxyacyl-CoA dehydrogenase [Paraburkholderia sp. USG1]
MSSSNTIHQIGVVGGGAMGRGIVQLLAQAGHQVYCFDAFEGAAAGAVEFVIGKIRRGVEKGSLSAAEFERICSSIHVCAALSDLAGCSIVIEAIVEDLEAKRQLFRALESVVADTAILASNTSSLTVAEIAAACARAQRVAGLHFFNPVPLMKVAEVVAAVRTSDATVQTLHALIDGAGHRAVITADQPGFLVNHAGRGLYTEGLRVVEEQVASPADVDNLLRDAAGFRMGPFELLDLTGLDVSSRVMTSIYEQFQHEPRFRPSSLVPPRVAAGLYGRKTGEGWYVYDGDRKQTGSPRLIPALSAGMTVWIDPQATGAGALAALASAAGVRCVDEPARADLLIVQPWGTDATTTAIERGLDASRCVALDPLPPFERHRTLMLTASTTGTARDAALALLASDGTPVTVINDSPGFVVQRVLATIVNIAANIAQRGIASVEDLEDAVMLGLGYPYGPLSWGDRIGGERVLAVLRQMQAATGDPRYRPSAWLVRRVGLGISLLTPEAKR